MKLRMILVIAAVMILVLPEFSKAGDISWRGKYKIDADGPIRYCVQYGQQYPCAVQFSEPTSVNLRRVKGNSYPNAKVENIPSVFVGMVHDRMLTSYPNLVYGFSTIIKYDERLAFYAWDPTTKEYKRNFWGKSKGSNIAEKAGYCIVTLDLAYVRVDGYDLNIEEDGISRYGTVGLPDSDPKELCSSDLDYLSAVHRKLMFECPHWHDSAPKCL